MGSYCQTGPSLKISFMKVSFLFAFFAFLFTNVHAQNAGIVSGSVSKAGNPVEGATVSLLRAKDSGIVKFSASDKQGRYSFDKVANGRYLVSVTAVGHQKAFSSPVTLGPGQENTELPVITLVAVSKDLGGVVVTARRPLIETKIDRTVVNVDASVTNIGTSALDVLEKAPGVAVDRDGNISLKGKQGVLVMVDGRPTQLSGADLANLLRNLSSNQLDQIEIMTNPPARYDAAGTSGIINIRTKKAITAGLNGSVTATYMQGVYPKTNEGFNFNYREGKFNLFSNLSHNYQKRTSIMNLDRKIRDENTNAVEEIFNQRGTRLARGNSVNGKIGVDFFATDRTTIGAIVNFNTRSMSMSNPTITNISNAAGDLTQVTSAWVDNGTEWSSISSNLNIRRLLDKKGREVTADIDWARHTMKNDLFMVNAYTDADGHAFGKPDTLTGLLPQDINIYSARVDYVQPLTQKAKIEAGVKTSVVKTDNNAIYDSIRNGQLVHDAARSNHFIYEENINAAYVNLSAPLSKKITGQFGLRMENTNANGVNRTTKEKFDRHYTQLFPTAYFQYKANDMNVFGFTIGRRVLRPSYQSLNPFIKFIDKYTYGQGNPNLKPSVSKNVELSHTWKNQVTTTINYSTEKDIINEVIQQKGQQAYNRPENIASRKQVGIAVIANNPVTKWWTSNVNINVYNDNYKGIINNAPIHLSATSFVFTCTQQFKLNKTLTAELNGRYRNGWLEGIMRARHVGFVGAGISQQVLKNRGSIRLTARDIFYTQKFRANSRYSNVDFSVYQAAETQVVSIGFTYSFSKGKKIAPVKRTAGGATEEQNRIGQ